MSTNEVTLKFVDGVENCKGCILENLDAWGCPRIHFPCDKSDREDGKTGIWVVK